MRATRFFSPYSRVIASMVHVSARRDRLQAGVHAEFIATRLAGGAAAIVVLPVYLALWGAPDLVSAVCFAWLSIPIAIAFYLSRTGRLGVAHVLSASTLGGLIVFVAAGTGGTASPVLAWLIVAPAEAALSGAGGIILASMAVSVLAVLGLTGADAAGLVPAVSALPGTVWTGALLGVLPVLVYVGLLGVRAAGMMRGFAARERADHQHLRHIADAATDPILTLRRNGNVTFSTKASEAMFSVPCATLTGDGLFRRVHVADRPAFLAALDDAAAGAITSIELRVDRSAPASPPDYIWVELRCKAMRQPGERSPDIVAVLSRIGTRKRAEGRLRVAHQEAERANIAKGRFLASMSHELRTPLNAIIGFSDILRTGPLEDGRGDRRTRPSIPELDEAGRREYAGLIHESGVHLLDVVNDILDMSKIDSGNFEISPEPFDVAEMIEGCRRMVCEQVAKAGLRLEMDLPHSVPKIRADRRACKQIVLNLLSNAVKFSRPGGRIVVGVYRDHAGAVLYVADEGVGIARSDLTRVGEPFCQLDRGYDRRNQGTGLGLSVVKGLVALHGGSMDIDSELGVGTRIAIRLPQVAVVEPVDKRSVEALDACKLTA